MAINPMQRRARNSFIVGFLIATLIMAIAILFLLKQMKAINEAKEALENMQSNVYVASKDLKSGDKITMEESFKMETVRTTLDKSKIISYDDFEYVDEEGVVVDKYAEDGSKLTKTLKMKIDVPAGTIVTKEMFYEEGKKVSDSQRIQEYNMIALPSSLKNGDYIDIRIGLPSGQDYIVLSKQEVIGTTTNGLWLELDEEELLIMNNVIVESYLIEGSKLYAIRYTEPGMQKAAQMTYTVSPTVLDLINTNPNITETARAELWNRYNAATRVNYFEPLVQDNASTIESAFNEELGKIRGEREGFVNSLRDSGQSDAIGYTREK